MKRKFSDRFSKILKGQIVWNQFSGSWDVLCGRTDRQTDRQTHTHTHTDSRMDRQR